MLNHEMPVDVVALTGSDQAVRSAAGRYFGFAIAETASTTAVVKIYDGLSASGTLLDTISLSANQSTREWYGPQGLRFLTGVFVHIASGTVEGSVRVA